jgi:hypothetical protein
MPPAFATREKVHQSRWGSIAFFEGDKSMENNAPRGIKRKTLILGILFLSIVDCILGLANAPIYNPSWPAILTIILGLWIASMAGARPLGVLYIAETVTAASIFYTSGIVKLRIFHFVFSVLALTLAALLFMRREASTP